MATRLNINVSDETAQLLKEMAERGETSVTEIVRRAVGVYKYVEDGARQGKDIQIVGPNDVTTIAIVR
jgi:predicted transcriptional regulator